MASQRITAKAGHITCFGHNGRAEGGNWVVDTEFGIPAEVDREATTARVAKLLEADLADGKLDQVAYVGVTHRVAVCLFLDGGLSVADVANAADNADGSVTIPEVTLVVSGQPMTVDVRVNPAFAAGMATYTAAGGGV